MPSAPTPQPDHSDEIFRTPRLRGRRWRDSDLGQLLAVYGDADAMRWVGDGRPLSGDEATQWLEVTRTNYAKRGYGMFAMESTANGEIVGFIGIVHPGGQVEPEVKYALARPHWSKGLATEALRAVVDYGRSIHGLKRMIATTAPENLASHRVLLKTGFVKGELRENDDGSLTQVFEWVADESEP